MKTITVLVQGLSIQLEEPTDCVINGRTYPKDIVAMYEMLIGVLWTPPEVVVMTSIAQSNVNELFQFIKRVRMCIQEMIERDLELMHYIVNNTPRMSFTVPEPFRNDPQFLGIVDMIKRSLRIVPE